MGRLLNITLEKREVSCVARLLDEEAPLTCELVWNSLPISGDAFHAKFSSNEVYCIMPSSSDAQFRLENPTIVPGRGDVLFFDLPADHLPYQIRADLGLEGMDRFSELALFYDRNNYLLNPATGLVPGNVFGEVIRNMEEMAEACRDVWRAGSVGERLIFSQMEE